MAQLHIQYMATHRQVTGNNESLGAKVTSLSSDLSNIRVISECLQWKRKAARDKLDELCLSNFLESQSLKQDTYDLKQCLLDLKNKAADSKA